MGYVMRKSTKYYTYYTLYVIFRGKHHGKSTISLMKPVVFPTQEDVK